MEVFEAVRTVLAVRSYKETPVPSNVIRVHDVHVMARVARMTDAIIRPELGGIILPR